MAGLALLVVRKASQETIAVVKIRGALRLSSSIQIFKNKHVSATPPNHAAESRARHQAVGQVQAVYWHRRKSYCIGKHFGRAGFLFVVKIPRYVATRPASGEGRPRASR